MVLRHVGKAAASERGLDLDTEFRAQPPHQAGAVRRMRQWRTSRASRSLFDRPSESHKLRSLLRLISEACSWA